LAWMNLQDGLVRLPGLLAAGRVSYTFDGIPLRARGMSLRKRWNLVRCGLDTLLGRKVMSGLPPTVQVEPTNICNLKCPLCPTGSDIMTRPKGSMSMETFQKILDELGDVLVTVVLYCWGEPFLNPDLPRMIAACTERGILTVTSTNGHCLQSLEEALAVVDAGLSGLVVAIDGSNQDIYETYRKTGDVDKVKRCAMLIEEAKARRGAALPYTDLRVVVTRQNEDDVPNIEKLARRFGFNMFSYKTLGCLTHSGEFDDYAASDVLARRHGGAAGGGRLVQCNFPFRQPTIFWDGTVVGCEFDYNLEMPFGKVGERPFMELWNSEPAVALRRSIRQGPRRPDFCGLCPYTERGSLGTVLLCKELRPARPGPPAGSRREGRAP